MKLIPSEDANETIWRMLSKYSYPRNIENYLRMKNYDQNQELIESTSGCITQARAYFKAFATSDLHISPLLLYYGTVSLLQAASNLRTGQIPLVNGHGLRLRIPLDYSRIGDIILLPNNPKNGGLQLYSDILAEKKINLTNGVHWKIIELLSMVPDVLVDYENCYADTPSHVLPVEVIKTRQFTFERIPIRYFRRFQDHDQAIQDIESFGQAYLKPECSGEYVFLRYKMKGKNIGCYSISGKKHLIVGYRKNSGLIAPELLTVYYMLLFGLGYISRYKPECWTPFVRGDVSGERLTIERFLYSAYRQFPNLILNLLEEEEIRFAYEIEGLLDLTSNISDDELNDVIDRRIEKWL